MHPDIIFVLLCCIELYSILFNSMQFYYIHKQTACVFNLGLCRIFVYSM